MPISQIAFVRSTVLAVLIGLLALFAIVGATLWLVDETEKNAATVTRSDEQRTELIELRNLLLDAETGQRGYLLTGKDSYLIPYQDAVTKIDAQLEHLHALLDHEAAQKDAVGQLERITKSKLDELGRTIELAKDQANRDAALALVNTDAGKNLMVEAHALLNRLVLRADQNIHDSLEDQKHSMQRLRLVTFASAFAIFVAGVGSAMMILRYMKQLAEAQRAVHELNIGLEERVLERTADLGRANDEIQRFAYIVTHDLRAPLVNIMGFTSELETSLAPIQACFGQQDEAARAPHIHDDARAAALEDLPEAIGFIRSSTRKMDGLINAILKLSREGRRTLKPEKVELSSLLQTVIDNVQHQVLDAGGHVSIEGRTAPIISDRLALDQIFGNLLDNAVKYRDKSRPLSIHIRIDNEPGRRLAVTVEDNGRGISPQDHERIFDLFRRSGPQDQPGEGIGLAHVRTMARNLGGDISVTSQLGKGTAFKVTLAKDLRKVIGAA